VNPRSIVSYAAQLGVLLAAVLGFVLTVLHHGDTNSYLGAVLPVIGGLGIVARLEARSDKQDAALNRITAQTNGVLDGRIRQGVRDVLHDLNLVAAFHNRVDAPLPDPVPAPVAAPAPADVPAPVAAPAPAPADVPAPVAPPLPVGFVENLADAVAEALAHRAGGTGA
jgi:hypothetical protein